MQKGLLEILECRNVGVRAYLNLKRLENHRFCTQTFSVLTIDPERHNVARLRPVGFEDVLHIIQEAEEMLGMHALILSKRVESAEALSADLGSTILEDWALPCCRSFLSDCGLI